MTRSRARAWLLVGAAPLLASCKSESAATPDAGPTTGATTAGATASALPPSHPPIPPHPPTKAAPLPCRVLVASGAIGVADAGAPEPGALIPEDATITLGAGAKLSLKSPKTGRELSFIGPARVRACVGDDDDVWLARGTFTSVPGSGEGPGAEQWVATPVGAVRYAGGALTVRVTDSETSVETTSGAGVYAFAAGDARPSQDAGTSEAGVSETGEWTQVAKGTPWSRRAGGAATPLGAARRELDRCHEASTSARDLATAMSFPDADLTVDAPAHIAARRAARATCAIAELRILELPPSGDKDALLAAVDRWSPAR